MWRLAKSIDTLKREVQSKYRGTTVWTIGDQDHQQGYSDHNPNSHDVVCAADFKGDGGMSLPWFVNHLITHPHENLRYVIHARKIYERSNGFAPRTYHGSNPHDTHVHVSVGNGPDQRSDYNYDSDKTWGIEHVSTPPTSPKPKPPTSGWTDKLMSDLPELREGSTGKAVERAQALLNVADYALTEDGKFGARTNNAVRIYQRSKGLTSDGVIGRNTWTKLVKG